MQILYQCDIRHIAVDEALAAYYESLYSEEHEKQPPRDGFMEELVWGTSERTVEIDKQIVDHSENWRIERMPAVDRNIIRMAIYELMMKKIPAAVVIDEALDLSRRFSGEDSVAFVNGVLDSIRKQLV